MPDLRIDDATSGSNFFLNMSEPAWTCQPSNLQIEDQFVLIDGQISRINKPNTLFTIG
jgi:hypothetical protein